MAIASINNFNEQRTTPKAKEPSGQASFLPSYSYP
jgi:hypothetical protein